MGVSKAAKISHIFTGLLCAASVAATCSCSVQGKPFLDLGGAQQAAQQSDNKPEDISGWTMAILDTKLQVNPKDSTIYILRGHLHQIRDEREEAIADYNKGIVLAPEKAESYLLRSETYLLMAQYDKAMADANKAVSLLPHSAPVYSMRARLESVMENYAAAIADVKKSLLYDPHDITATSSLAQSYDSLGQYSAALGVADYAVESDSQTRPDALYYSYQDRALILTHAAQYEAARKDMDAGIALSAKESQLYAYLALLEAMQDHMDGAKKAIEQTMRLDTFAPRANRLKGEMYRAAGQWKNAIESYDKSTTIEPDYGPGFTQKAIAEIALGLYPNAERDLLKATKLVPTSAIGHSYLALALAAQSQDSQAQKEITRAFELTPDLPTNFVNRAALSYIKGDLAKALADCQEAVKLNPYQADAYALIADVLKRGGHAKEAAPFDQRAKNLGWHAREKPLPLRGQAILEGLTVPTLPPYQVLKALPFTLVDPDAAP